MKNSIFTISLLLAFYLPGQAQTHTINISNFAFSPQNLVINAGEEVQWSSQEGTHNVNGSTQSYPDNPESFGSGNPALAPWNYTHTFNTPGTYQYHCDLHFSMGMTGTITVLPQAQSDIVITEFMYNPPGPDTLEFIELYNNGSSAVNMTDWALAKAVDFTFPTFTLGAGEYVLISNNAAGFQSAFGLTAFQWNTGSALNNTGETIMLKDNAGIAVDSVSYLAGSGGWPAAANGQGASMVLCDYNSDNNVAANWAAATTPTSIFIGTTEILANPGEDSQCSSGPVISFLFSNLSLLENAGTAYAYVVLSGGNANPTSVTLSLGASSTASEDDYQLALPQTLTFPAGNASDTIAIPVEITDDTEIEPTEILVLELANPTNGAIIAPNGSAFTITILDNDTPLTGTLVITGIYDTQPAGAGVKGIELQAIQDIPDLSIFGVESANNGGGANGVETTLAAVPLSAGECYYIADDSTKFFSFFGFYPHLQGSAVNVNGDDAIVLYENNQIIDVFGEVTHSGGNLPWLYTDGWAYRKGGTGPDGSIFVLDNWIFSGVDALDNVQENASAPNPFPTCSYTPTEPTTVAAKDDQASTPFNTPVTINVLANDVLPNPLTSLTVTLSPANGTATANGLDNITYTPEADFCGTDAFTYEICDATGCDEATVTVTVECPVSYPAYDIDLVTTVNNTGHPDSLNVTCELRGIVHGIDIQGGTSIQFVIIDQTGGITVFGTKSFGYTVQEGDEVVVQGKISEFNCLTQISADTIWAVSSGNPLATPYITTFLGEEFESELVELTNLTLVNPSQWLGNGSSFNVEVTNGTFTNTMRIDNDCELSTMPAPTGSFHARGLGGQFDNNGPCDDGYQFLPRYAADIIPLNSTQEELLGEKIVLYPNPAAEQLFIQTTLKIDEVSLSNLLGQKLRSVASPGNSIEVGDLQAGIYLLSFRVGQANWTTKFVKH